MYVLDIIGFKYVLIANEILYCRKTKKVLTYFLKSSLPKSSTTPNRALIELGPSIKASDSSHGIAFTGKSQTKVLCKEKYKRIKHLLFKSC